MVLWRLLPIRSLKIGRLLGGLDSRVAQGVIGMLKGNFGNVEPSVDRCESSFAMRELFATLVEALQTSVRDEGKVYMGLWTLELNASSATFRNLTPTIASGQNSGISLILTFNFKT